MASTRHPAKPSRGGRIVRLILRVMLFGLVAGLIAVVAAVLLTMASLPSFGSLTQKPNGQTVRVHAADGALLV